MEEAGTGSLVPADMVLGAAIYDTTGGNLGSIDDILIDSKSGNVAYAIISSGGHWGIGNRYHPLPWSMLKYDTNLGGYRVDLKPGQLEAAPAYGRWH